MKALTRLTFITSLCLLPISASWAGAYVKAGDPALQEWLLPEPAELKGNDSTPARIELGKKLFFEPRISANGNMSCGTCHNPSLGWSDGMPTAVGHNGKVLGRATPSVVNTVYNSIQMWDGRKKDLEDQAMGPMQSREEMHASLDAVWDWLNSVPAYQTLFEHAYPGEGINPTTFAKAIAVYERELVVRNTPFDRWVAGDDDAMTEQQVRGFELFLSEEKGACAVCHSAPNFTDNGFHNLGLASFGVDEPDLGRYSQKPIRLMKGAFKTPPLRNVTLTAPYFHDGSASTLRDVVNHYASGGVVKTNLSPNFKAAQLSEQEIDDLVQFLQALTGPSPDLTLPVLP